MKEVKTLQDLKENLESSIEKAEFTNSHDSRIRARVYHYVLESVNNIISNS